jgi:hypothetical protein
MKLGRKGEMLKYLELAEEQNDWDYQKHLENLLKALQRQE